MPWFTNHDPDVIVGWSVIQFDLRVLQKTADANSVQLLLGRERRPIAWRTHPGRQGYLFAPMPRTRGCRWHRSAQGWHVELPVVQP
jgi:DNA polymerase-2